MKNALFVFSILIAFFYGCVNSNTPKRNVSINHASKPKVFTDSLSVVVVGDMMLGSAFPNKKLLPKDDAQHSFSNVRQYLKGDIVFGNLEGCFLDTGKSVKCKDTIANSCYAFRMPERYAPIFKKTGFNLLSIANNHIGDFGNAGRNRTVALLDSLSINYAGLTTHPYSIFKKGGITYAFCAFAPNSGTVSINNIHLAKELIHRLKAQANIVIVSFHGGSEGADFERIIRKNEFFFNENRGDVYAFAHAVIDAGADVVLGHGPHVTRAVEVYKNKFIAYSLGNFNTYGTFSLNGPNGIAPLLQLKINTNGDFLCANVVSIKQDKVNCLTIDKQQSAYKKIIALTNSDFIDHQLNFPGNGRIELKTKSLANINQAKEYN